MDSDTANQQIIPAQTTSQKPVVNTPASNQKGFVPAVLGVLVLLN